MPRGVYKRGPRVTQAVAPEAAPIAPQPVAATAALVESALPPAPPASSLAPEGLRKSTSKDVDALAGDELRAYARSVGVSPRDCAGLTEDRLRQNTKLVIHQTYELLTE